MKKDFYPTWQEASASAIALEIDSYLSYDQLLDERFPSCPATYYKDFPGWNVFLNLEERYATWQEASEVAINLNIKSPADYKRKRYRDTRLPKSPSYSYKDFPDWDIFLGKK